MENALRGHSHPPPTRADYRRLALQRRTIDENAEEHTTRSSKRRATRPCHQNDQPEIPTSSRPLMDITNQQGINVPEHTTSVVSPSSHGPNAFTESITSYRTIEVGESSTAARPAPQGQSSFVGSRPRSVNNNNAQRRTRERVYHRCAINFHERRGIPTVKLDPPRTCPHCQAVLFHQETSNLCCAHGKITLPNIPVPDELLSLYTSQTAIAKHFRHNIRKYNHLFSFTSMGVHLDESLANAQQGVYTFRAQGSIYHSIGNLLPPSNDRPRYLQLYIYDTEHELEHRLAENNTLRPVLIETLKSILDRCNPFVQNFRSLAQRDDTQHCRLIIKEQPVERRQYCLPSASQVAGIIVGGEEVANLNDRDIKVESNSGRLLSVPDTAGYYDPLQYPLLLPYGSYGWSINSRTPSGGKISCRGFYAHLFQIRRNVVNIFLLAERLLQQYAVDNFVKSETNKLRWVRDHQDTLRAEIYKGLQDCLDSGEANAGNSGRKVILPSSFVGSPRDMNQRYQDAMALVNKYGKPDYFLTMTCNPSWKEITDELLPGQTSSDRPDLVARIFNAKFQEMKTDVVEKGVLGKVIAYVYVVEFQKRGLPHVHMLIIVDENDKPRSPDDYNKGVRAEIPDKEEEPELFKAVMKHHVHGPCGEGGRNTSCMENGVCKRGYPKPFSATTMQGANSYPVYRRRADGPSVPLGENSSTYVDNRWIVPYNPWLLLKYDCHINVEICSSIKSVKYLYKYVHKGVDRISMEVRSGENYDEIRQFVDARWVCAPEAFWRLYQFEIARMWPSVERLQLHLPNMHQVQYRTVQNVNEVLNDPKNSRTKLTEFFRTNAIDPHARNLLYREFPEAYRWMEETNTWRRRRSNQKVIGRMYTASPTEGERYFLRLLLNHVRGPESFEHLRTVNGVTYPTFREAAEKLGLLENDASIRECLREASESKMPSALRRLFVTILVYCQPTGVRSLWDEFFPFMAEDYSSSTSSDDNVIQNCVLCEIDRLLKQLYQKIEDFDLPKINMQIDGDREVVRAIRDEMNAVVPPEDVRCAEQLNHDQRSAFDAIMEAIDSQSSGVFFIDGPGGTGKTFLYRAILATVKLKGLYGLAAASSGIAATLLCRAKTAHKTFGLPVQLHAASMWKFSKQSAEANLIKHASVIIWDEATMTHRHAFEAVDRSMRDLMGVDLPFGGKVMVFGGDFRQVLPVIPKGTRAETVDACFVRSVLWRHVRVLRLTENMRSRLDPEFGSFLLRVGDGNEPAIDDMIRLPSSMCLQPGLDNSVDNLVDEIFPNLGEHVGDVRYMVERAIVTPLNNEVDTLNGKIEDKFVGDGKIYYSIDSVPEDRQNLYQQEFLNSLSFGGLPPHILKLKVGLPIMLLRNIDPGNGLCNGTRLICCHLGDNVIEAEIMTGHCKGTRVFIPRIPLRTAEDVKLPFQMIRKQFPVKLCFALTINKSQGQTIPHVGVYLPQHVFSHGQLYVALSRGTSQHTTKVLVTNGRLPRRDGVFTKNVVYKEVFLHNAA